MFRHLAWVMLLIPHAVLPQTPGTARELASQGWEAFESNRLSEAEQLLSQAVKLDAKEPDYQAALGAVLAKQGKWSESSECWKKAVQLSPRNTEFRLQLARAYQASDRDLEALSALELSDIPDPFQKQWVFTRAFSLFRIGRYPAAQKDFESLRSDPAFSAPANFFLGNLFFAQDQFKQAADYFGQALRDGDRPDNRAFNAYAYDYGLALYHLRDFNAAAAAFQKSIDRYPNDPLPWLWLGRSKQELGAYTEAIADLEESIRIRPDFRASYFQLARLHYQYGNKKRAAELFAKVNQMKQSERAADERAAAQPKLGGSHATP